jgi:hypothetical protein
MPDLRLSEEAFPSSGAVAEDVEVEPGAEDELVEGTLVVDDAEPETEAEPTAEADAEPTAESETEVAAEAADEPEADSAES